MRDFFNAITNRCLLILSLIGVKEIEPPSHFAIIVSPYASFYSTDQLVVDTKYHMLYTMDVYLGSIDGYVYCAPAFGSKYVS